MIRKKRLRGLSEMVRVFFLCLDEMRWNDADVAIRKIQACETDKGEESSVRKV